MNIGVLGLSVGAPPPRRLPEGAGALEGALAAWVVDVALAGGSAAAWLDARLLRTGRLLGAVVGLCGAGLTVGWALGSGC